MNNERLRMIEINNYTCVDCGKKKTIRNTLFPKNKLPSCIKCNHCGGNMWEEFYLKTVPGILKKKKGRNKKCNTQ